LVVELSLICLFDACLGVVIPCIWTFAGYAGATDVDVWSRFGTYAFK